MLHNDSFAVDNDHENRAFDSSRWHGQFPVGDVPDLLWPTSRSPRSLESSKLSKPNRYDNAYR